MQQLLKYHDSSLGCCCLPVPEAALNFGKVTDDKSFSALGEKKTSLNFTKIWIKNTDSVFEQLKPTCTQSLREPKMPEPF